MNYRHFAILFWIFGAAWNFLLLYNDGASFSDYVIEGVFSVVLITGLLYVDKYNQKHDRYPLNTINKAIVASVAIILVLGTLFYLSILRVHSTWILYSILSLFFGTLILAVAGVFSQYRHDKTMVKS